MEYIRELLDDLKKTNCEKSDEVVDLMFHIAYEIKAGELINPYFTELGKDTYARKKDIDNHYELALETCKENGVSIFDVTRELTSGIKDSLRNWFMYSEDRNAYYDIDISKLRKDKKEFIKVALRILGDE